jgi:phosphoribosylamine--glycine ligase
MGGYSSDELLPAGVRDAVISTIVEPTLRGLANEGIPYQGFLYIGLMLTKDGPKVLEFNCRLGDPEAQAIVARMDFDLAEVLADVAMKQLDPTKLEWKKGASACIVLASGGYPGKFDIGKNIEGLTSSVTNTGVEVFHAGTRREGDSLVTSGGRVLGVTAAADSLAAALGLAYRASEKIHFAGMHYRKDIGAQMGPVKATGD